MAAAARQRPRPARAAVLRGHGEAPRHARGWTEGAKGAITAELAATAFDPSDQRFDTWMRAAHEWWCRAWRCLPFTSCIIKDKSYHIYQYQ